MAMVNLSSYINDQLDRLSEIKVDSERDESMLKLEIERSRVVSELVKSGVAVARVHLEVAQHIDEINPTDKNAKPSQDILEVLGFE